MANHPVDLTTAKAGEEVTLRSGKVIISDGKGGGRVKRKKKKVVSNGETAQKQQQEQAAAEQQAAQEAAAQAVASQSAQNEGTVARGIRAAAGQGGRLTDLIRQGRGR